MFVSPTEIERRRALSQQLRGQGMRQDGFGKTSALEGIAHMIRQWGAGKGEAKAAEQEAANRALRQQEMSLLSQAIANGGQVQEGGGALKTPAQFQHPDTQAIYLQHQLNDAAGAKKFEQQRELAEIRGQFQAERSPYFTPIPTADGLVSFNNRTGGVSPVDIPVIRSQDDPKLQSQLKEAEGIGDLSADALAQRQTAARDASAQIASIHEQRRLLDEGIRSGAMAESRQGFGRLLMSLGLAEGDDPTAATDAYVAASAKNVANVIKAFGSGTGLSDADRAYAEGLAGGNIQMNEEALTKILDINERAARRAITGFNEMLEDLPKQYTKLGLGIDMPAEYQAPEASQGLQIGDIVDGHRFKGGDPSQEENWEFVQ